MIGLFLSALLSQGCEPYVQCSAYGFQSRAGVFGGSGAPDFICGNQDNLSDGGWGSASKYCKLETRESDSYSGMHGDLTISTGRRSAGLLFSVENGYWSSGFSVFSVDFAGNVSSWGSYYAAQNGGGVRNLGSYLGLAGWSSNPKNHPDVQIRAWQPHYSGGYVMGVESGSRGYVFKVRDDGALSINGKVLQVTASDTGLRFTEELPDGGTRAAELAWGAP